MLLKDYVKTYQDNNRMGLEKAKVRVCQDLLMSKLKESKYINSFTFKGGTIMYELSKNARRSTLDVDIDVIGTSISKENLIRIFNEIGLIPTESGISFHVEEDSVKELNHEAYKGKRLSLLFEDLSNDSMSLVLDIGVHTCLDIQQNQLMFVIEPSKTKLKVFVNPPEKLVVEKTMAIVKRGILSSRMKDIFDIYFIINKGLVDRSRLINTFNTIIKRKNLKPDNLKDYLEQYVSTLATNEIKDKLRRSDNWLDVEVDVIVETLVIYFSSLNSY